MSQLYKLPLTEDQITLLINALNGYTPYSWEAEDKVKLLETAWELANCVAQGELGKDQ